MKPAKLLPYRTLPCLFVFALAGHCQAQAVTVITTGTDARACYEAATRADLRSPGSLEDLASCDRALQYQKLSRNDRASTLVNRGIVRVAQAQYNEAMADYNAALVLVPRMPEVYISRGNLWFLADKYQRAIEEYTLALQSGFSRLHIAYYNRGLANDKLGNQAAAIADLQQALNLMPDFKLASGHLAELNNRARQ